METISVGMLLPTSGIRQMSKDFSKAFKKAINRELEGSGFEVEVFPEMIGTGAPVQVEIALDKMFGYHGVDAVTGIASHPGIAGYTDKFKKQQIPLLLNNLGEHMVPTRGYNEYVFQNSVHLWQQCWLLGYFAGSQLEGNSLIISAMYDSGYAFLIAYEMGIRAANPDVIHQLKLLPLPQPGQLSNVNEAFGQVDFDQYDKVMALFCGEEATMFLEEFKKRDFHKTKNLLGLPFLLEAGDSDLSGIEMYTASHQQDDLFYDKIYRQMGEFSGMAIGKAILDGEGQLKPDILKAILSEHDPGRIFDSTDAACLTEPVRVYHHSIGVDNQLTSEKVFEKKVELDNDPDFTGIRNSENSQWVNPYLCI